MSVQKITKRVVDAASPPTDIIRDTEVKGFLLIVSKNGHKTYGIEYRVGNGRGAPKRRYSIGAHGSPWTPDQARSEAKRLLSLVAQGTDPLTSRYAHLEEMTLKELCEHYLKEGTTHKKISTLRGDKSRINHYLIPQLGKRPISSVQRADVERLVREVSTMPAKMKAKKPKGGIIGGPGAAFQCLAVLGAIYSFAVRRGLCKFNPTSGVKKPPVRKMERFLSDSEVAALGDALATEEKASGTLHLAAAIKLLLLTGCRKGEILDLHWKDVDFENRCLRLRDSKTGAKIVYLNDGALNILRRLPKVDGNPFVIVGSKVDSGHAGIDGVWHRVRRGAKLTDVRLHDLRHSFASIAVKNGLSLPIVGALLGHKHPVTTMRYAHLAAEPLRSAVDTIGMNIALDTPDDSSKPL
ncbi:tyrosine-type recombinase/integrase [Tardiphaga sp. 20_F10_N6_6]|uniref:tyrosine-type recombinase/integrase n=1 Tax=Tardiphaga sp. 20_F10_N6_6 TaxID=3240788 RepID=UPI003F88CD3D